MVAAFPQVRASVDADQDDRRPRRQEAGGRVLRHGSWQRRRLRGATCPREEHPSGEAEEDQVRAPALLGQRPQEPHGAQVAP